MPLLALFSKKNRSSSKVSTAAYSNSNVSLNDEEYVSVPDPSLVSHHAQPSATSSKLALPFRKRREKPASEDHSHSPQSDPLLEPPPRRSSLFQTYQDDHNAYRSVRSLPDEAEQTSRPQQQSTPSKLVRETKKSMFSWSSHKERGKPMVPAQPGASEGDASFNLRSFRHVRPDSPGLGSSGARSSSQAPVLPPIPTTFLPSPPVSFQVTSRRPRGDSFSELTTPGSSPLSASQQKMAVGAFRQAARRSATSLSLTDSPMISPVRTSLDDRPPPSLLPLSQAATDSPPRPQPPLTINTPKFTPSPISSNLSVSASSRSVTSPLPKPSSIVKPLRTRTNAFADSSSSSSSSEEEDEDEESTSDAGVGAPRISRRRTITQNKDQANATTLPPLSSSARQQILRATPPVASSSMLKAATTNDVPRAQSSLGVYTRPRASLSVGALTPTAKETRASIALAANARLANTTATPRATPRSLTHAGSDTSESADSGGDSEEDAPLSSLILPRRPGTSLSSHSTRSTVRRPLVDLDAPSTLTGKPIRAPALFGRDEEGRQRSKVSAETGTRSRPSPAATPQSNRSSQAPVLRDSWLSQGTSSNSRVSQALSSRTTASYDTPTTSFSGSSGRLSTVAPNSGSENRVSLTGNPPSFPPVAPPMRPFARRESPASSTGDSSSGMAPLTPRDGSDTRSAYSKPSAMSGKGRPGAHGRKPSVTFEDEKEGAGKGKQRDDSTADEARRKERRRSEARAAIELGNVVNGPPPVDDDDLVPSQQHMGMQGGWPQPAMQMQMQPVAPMFNMGMGMPSPGGYGMNYPPPAPNPDPAFLVAHQQAMAIAKQTFQYAVAQQALAAANDEWERSSTMTGYGGPAPTPPWGYGMGMRQGVMLPPAPRSMYAGSIGGVSGGWGGTGSAYGNGFGPAAAGGRNSTYSQVDLSAGAQRPARPRTKTAPSAASPPTGISNIGRMPAPPSSFRGPGRTHGL